jgi:hypothetical protein
MMSVEYKIKETLKVPMRFEELYGQKVAIYEMSHKQALRKLLKTMDINEITKHTVYMVPGRYMWRM